LLKLERGGSGEVAISKSIKKSLQISISARSLKFWDGFIWVDAWIYGLI